EHGGADAAPRVAHRRRTEDLEALADGPPVLQPLVRLLAGARRDVRDHGHGMGAVVRGDVRRQAACAPESHHAPPEQDPLQEGEARRREATEAAEAARGPGARLSVHVGPREVRRSAFPFAGGGRAPRPMWAPMLPRTSPSLLVMVLALGCPPRTTRRAPAVKTSGFLGDYSRLQPGGPGHALLVYRAPDA